MSAEGSCKESKTSVYLKKSNRVIGHFDATFSDGKSLYVHFRTKPLYKSKRKLLCE